MLQQTVKTAPWNTTTATPDPSPETIVKKQYRSVELSIAVEGGFVRTEEVTRLSTLIAQEENEWTTRARQLKTAQSVYIRHEDTATKRCLANLVPGLPEATTMVHIPNVTIDGEDLDEEQLKAVFWQACAVYGAPMWTQSSIKGRTFYFVQLPVWETLAARWNDIYKLANYGGLLFSETTSKVLIFTVNTISDAPEHDGVDGCCGVNTEAWGEAVTTQFRAMQVDADGLPVAIAKGIANPRSDVEGIEINDTQVKYGNIVGTWLLLKNENVNCKPRRVWLAPQVCMMLDGNPEVVEFLTSRTKNALQREIMDVMDDPLKLAQTMGALRVEGGRLAPVRRAVEEAYRCDMPRCWEVESRAGRVLVMRAVKIALAGGIYGEESVLVISDEHGADFAKPGEERFMLVRNPVNGPKRIVFLSKNPWKRGQGYVVTKRVADALSGDADGDYATLVKDRKVVQFFLKHLRKDLEVDMKPVPTKLTGPVSASRLEDVALQQLAQGWVIGTANNLAWKLMQGGEVEAAALALWYTDTAPMINKHNLSINGKSFMASLSAFMGKWREKMADVTLQWHEKAALAEEWDSVREMGDHVIEKPVTHMDHMWNAAAELVRQWANANPLYDLSLSHVGRVTFAKTGATIPAWAYREMRESFIVPWGQYWGDHTDPDTDEIESGDHSGIYDKMREAAMDASDQALTALMCWKPVNGGDGFGLKWVALFSTGLAHRYLGYNAEVRDYLKNRGIGLDTEADFLKDDAKSVSAKTE